MPPCVYLGHTHAHTYMHINLVHMRSEKTYMGVPETYTDLETHTCMYAHEWKDVHGSILYVHDLENTYTA